MREIRLDRLASLYFFQPLQRLIGHASGDIPILMYHSISEDRDTRRSAYYRTCTAPRVFLDQMKFLSRNGYQAIGLNDAIRKIGEEVPIEGKFVILTFDDGFHDFYTQAFPVLSELGYPATVFLPTAYIGESTLTFNGKECLRWSEVRELRDAGIQFGSHTVTHPQLRRLPPSQILQEVRASKQEIEDRLGEPIRSFSYPYAFPENDRGFKRDLRTMLERSGYRNGVTTILGTVRPSSDPLFLERLPVNSADDVDFFNTKLRGGYNWLHAVQLGYKSRTGIPWAAIDN